MNDPGKPKFEKVGIIGVCGPKIGFGWERGVAGGGGGGARLRGEEGVELMHQEASYERSGTLCLSLCVSVSVSVCLSVCLSLFASVRFTLFKVFQI